MLSKNGIPLWLKDNMSRVSASVLAAYGLVAIKLSQSYYLDEIVAMLAAGTAVLLAGGWVVFRAAQAQPWDGWGWHFPRLFAHQESQQPEAVQHDWLGLIETAHKPGRRSPALPIGFDDEGLVEIPMKNAEAHLFISGITGTGKSVLINQMIIAAAASGRYQVVIVSLSGKDYQIVKPMKNVHLLDYGSRSSSPAQAMDDFANDLPLIMASFNREVVARQQQATQYGVREYGQIRADVRRPSILFVIEEFTNAAEQVQAAGGKKALAELFGQTTVAVQYGRSSNMHLVLLGQRPTAQVPNNIKKQMVMVSLRVADGREAAWATGLSDSGAENLRVADPKNGIEGEAFVAGAYTRGIVSVPLTDDETLKKAATMHEGGVRFLGHPSWLHGWQDGQASPPRDMSTVLAVPTPYTQNPPERIDPKPAKNGVGTGQVSTAPKRHIKMLDATTVATFAKRLYKQHPDFAELTDAYTRERTVAILLCQHGGLSENEIMLGVFGNRGRYREYVKLCATHYKRLHVAWYERQRAKVMA